MQPTIILIPGLMNDAWIWSGQIAALSRHGAVLVARNDGFDSLAAMADDLLGRTCGPLAVAGHSMGGRVALEMFRRAPERIDRLALLDTGVHGRRDHEREGRMKLVDLARTEGMGAVVEAWLPQMLAPGVVRGGPVWQGIADMLQRADADIFASQQNALLTREDAEPLLAQVKVPVALIVGRDDGWSPPEQHEAMTRHLAHSRLTVIENAGHMAPLEKPDAVADALVDWLKM